MDEDTQGAFSDEHGSLKCADGKGKSSWKGTEMGKRIYERKMQWERAVTIKDMPGSERPREKLMKHGVKYLSNAELLALLIGTGAREKSALELAKSVLAMEEEGISYLANCMPEELCRIKGIGAAKACRLTAAIEIGKRVATAPRGTAVQLDSPGDIADLFMEEMRYERKEFFKVLLLNTKNEIIMIDNVAVGSLDLTVIHPREVFQSAMRKSASAVVLVHNHPSGSPAPSPQDLKTTAQLVEAGKILGIIVLDHLIIGDGVYISMREQMLM